MTDWKEVAKEYKDKVSYLENIIALMPGHVYWKGMNGRYLGCNNNQAKDLNLKSREDIVNRAPYQNLSEDRKLKLKKIDNEVLEKEKTVTEYELGIRDNGDSGVFLTQKTPLYSEEEKIIGLLGISFDVTDEKKAEKMRQEKEAAEKSVARMKLIAGSIAHELRTPFASIKLNIENLSRTLPFVMHAYHQIKKGDVPVSEDDEYQIENLMSMAKLIEEETLSASAFVEMLLMNVKDSTREYPMSVLSIKDCILDTIKRYPFQEIQRERVELNLESDFKFNGNHELIVHIFFNLLKNALYYLEASSKKEAKISIQIERENPSKIFFKDTGKGISKNDIDSVFDHFYGRTDNGTGVGLAFCKMGVEQMQGTISCDSVEGSYTEFVIELPLLKG